LHALDSPECLNNRIDFPAEKASANICPILSAASVSIQNVAEPRTSATRIPALDGLRGVAILLVLAKHAIFGLNSPIRPYSWLLKCGKLSWSGVDLFFVLSGFLIGGILVDARESPNYFKTFYIRRAYRIFPLYLAVIGIFLLRYLPFHWMHVLTGDLAPLTIPVFAYLTLMQNFWMASIGTYGPPATTPTWSLAVEEQFYLTMPLLIRKLRPRTLVITLASIVVGAPLIRLWLRSHVVHGDFASYVLTPCRADALCLGVLAAIAIRHRSVRDWIFSHVGALRTAALLLLIPIGYMTVKGYVIAIKPPANGIGYSLLAVFYTVCLLLVLSRRGLLHRVLTIPPLMSLGTLAYCTYLIHFPVIQAIRPLFRNRLPYPLDSLLAGVLGSALSVALAGLSWKYFEKPMLRRGRAHVY
jgi:peptidoglycan/LPS O-acetylase OafA/YrhL